MVKASRTSNKPVVKYVADGIVKEFFYNFVTFNTDDIDVYVGEELLSSGYIVEINEENGGKVVFNQAPEAGKTVTIIRNLDIKRTSDFQESGAFRAKVINHELDYQVASLQQLDEKISRTVIFPPYTSDQADANLPLPEAGRAIVWNAAGDKLINSNLPIDTAFLNIDKLIGEAKSSADASLSEANNSKTYADDSLESSEKARKWAIGNQAEQAAGSSKYWADNAQNSAATYNVPFKVMNSSELPNSTFLLDWNDNDDVFLTLDGNLRFFFDLNYDENDNPTPSTVWNKSYVKRFIIATGSTVYPLTFEYGAIPYLLLNNTIPTITANSTYLCVMSVIPEHYPDPECPEMHSVLVSMAKYIEK